MPSGGQGGPPPDPPATPYQPMPNVNVVSPGNPQGPQHTGGNQTINVYVTNPHQYSQVVQGEDSSFAIWTLVAWFFCSPAALIMNVIGLITGPRRGCFLAMFLLILIPYVISIIVLIILIAAGAFQDFQLPQG